MLALVTAPGARLDAGSVGIALARSWAEAGRRVLFIDADVEGSALARRLGEATRAEYLPAQRGMPSLIAARRPLTNKLIADHCYSLDTGSGSLWSLFAPFHPNGAAHAAGWFAERTSDVLELDREHTVLLASGNLRSSSPWIPLLHKARTVVFLAEVNTPNQATALSELCDEAGLTGVRLQYRLLVIEGTSSMTDQTIQTASGLHVAGRLPVLEDERVLRMQGGRRERAFARAVQTLAEGLLPLSDTESGGGRHAVIDGDDRSPVEPPELYVVTPEAAAAEPPDVVDGESAAGTATPDDAGRSAATGSG